MKHLEESNATNQAELEENSDLAEIEREKTAEEHAARCASPSNRQTQNNSMRASNRDSVEIPAPNRDETASAVTLTTTVGPTTHDTINNRIENTKQSTE